MYYWYLAGFGNAARLANPYISPIDTPFFVALISLATQLFYSYRIYKVRNSFWPLATFIGLVSNFSEVIYTSNFVQVSLMQAGSGMYNGINVGLASRRGDYSSS